MYYRHLISADTAEKLMVAARERMHRVDLSLCQRHSSMFRVSLARAILDRMEDCAPGHDCGMSEVADELGLRVR